MFTPIEIRDIIERAIATAIQSGIAVFVVTDLSTARAALAAAAAGAITVVQRAAQRRLARPEVR